MTKLWFYGKLIRVTVIRKQPPKRETCPALPIVAAERKLELDKINVYLLLFISVLVSLTWGIIRNTYSKKHVKTITDYYVYNCLSSIMSMLVLIALSGGVHLPSFYTVILGTAFGMAIALASISYLQALTIGPFSYTTVIITASLIIPALSGRLIWGEQIAAVQYIGMVLMFVSIVISVQKGKDEKGTSLKWLLYSLGAFVFGGSIGLMQKIHQSSSFRNEINEFLIVAFFISTLFSLIMWFWYSRYKGVKKSITLSLKSSTFLMAIVSGVCMALANIFNLFLSGKMDSAVFYPVVNGGGLLMTTIVAIVFFREKLSKKQWLGLIVGIVAILLLCNLF